MDHYDLIVIGLSIAVGVGALGLIWLTVKIVGWIVKRWERGNTGGHDDLTLVEYVFGMGWIAIGCGLLAFVANAVKKVGGWIVKKRDKREGE